MNNIVENVTRNKYKRLALDCLTGDTCCIDVYTVLHAYEVLCPARQHAIKKLLCAGLRGKGDTLQDLTEARVAIDRAIEIEEAGKLAREQDDVG